jgi:hypothetical protein
MHSSSAERTHRFTREDLRPRIKDHDEWADFEKILRDDIPIMDAYAWWQNNRGRFPTLYRLAQQFLIVPGTSASSERQFSKAKRLKNKGRWSLKPGKLSAMAAIAENRDLVEELMARRRRETSSNHTDLSQGSADSEWQ